MLEPCEKVYWLRSENHAACELLAYHPGHLSEEETEQPSTRYTVDGNPGLSADVFFQSSPRSVVKQWVMMSFQPERVAEIDGKVGLQARRRWLLLLSEDATVIPFSLPMFSETKLAGTRLKEASLRRSFS